MKKEIKTFKTVCDCCEVELLDNGIRTNGGKFEEPYLHQGDIDLCFSCAGKIFTKNIVNKISEDKLKEFINSIKDKNNFVSSIPDMVLFKKQDNVSDNVPDTSSNTLNTLNNLSDFDLTNSLKDL